MVFYRACGAAIGIVAVHFVANPENSEWKFWVGVILAVYASVPWSLAQKK